MSAGITSLPPGAIPCLSSTHAEYVTLVRSRHDGVCFDRVESAFQRYVIDPVQSHHEIWSFRHQRRKMRQGTILRIIVGAQATIVWSADHWTTSNRSDSRSRNGLNLWFADLPTDTLPGGFVVEFTIFWIEAQRWEETNWQVAVDNRSALKRALEPGGFVN